LELLPITVMAVLVTLITPYNPSITNPSTLLKENNILYIALITFPNTLGIFNYTRLPLTYGKYLGKIFISPMAHMIHHSRLLVNKNMGNTLSIWDIMFGTYYEAKTSNDYFKQQSNVGLPEVSDNLYKNIFHATLIPFKLSFFIF
jgi:sterol desaturase/sphingolipid hydroxylase (fatty acid hydroxylase superfamily)